MAWTFLGRSGRNPDEWWVPGATAMGIDTYNSWSPSNGAAWTTFEEGMAPVRSYAGTVPLLVAEYGCRTPPDEPTRAGSWMRDAFEYAYRNDIIGLSYFDSSPQLPRRVVGSRRGADAGHAAMHRGTPGRPARVGRRMVGRRPWAPRRSSATGCPRTRFRRTARLRSPILSGSRAIAVRSAPGQNRRPQPRCSSKSGTWTPGR